MKLKGTELVKLLGSVVFTGMSEGGRRGWEEDRRQEGKRKKGGKAWGREGRRQKGSMT